MTLLGWLAPGACVTQNIPVLLVRQEIITSSTSIFLHLVEFGAIGAIGTNYPTTGFGAAYTLAHEIGISIILAS